MDFPYVAKIFQGFPCQTRQLILPIHYIAAIFHHQEYSNSERPGEYLLTNWTPEIDNYFKNVNSSILTKDRC
nr:unnamed protein product [Digitaria exilis]